MARLGGRLRLDRQRRVASTTRTPSMCFPRTLVVEIRRHDDVEAAAL